MAYRRVHKLDTKILRIFNTYGPRMRMMDGRVVPNFIYQILNRKPLTIYGKGAQTRSFCYVSDMVEGIVKLLFSNISGPVNIGNPNEFTIMEFARLISDISGVKMKVIYQPLPVDDPKQRRPDITLAKTKLSWQPKVELRQGLEKTIEWFAAQNSCACCCPR